MHLRDSVSMTVKTQPSHQSAAYLKVGLEPCSDYIFLQENFREE